MGMLAGACGGSSRGDDGALQIPGSCVLTPRQVEGPYFFPSRLARRDIREGRPGTPLTVRVQVVDVDRGCTPIEDAMVEAWHCDADGIYSGFDIEEGNLADAGGETFLRGYQQTDRSGLVEFQTIYPGWYPIRTVHIHLMVLIDGTEQVTTQVYFDQAVTDRVFATPPYSERGPQRTRNETDPFGGSLAELSFALQQGGAGWEASFLLGISRAG